MTERELRQRLKTSYPLEDEKCEWKEYKNLKHAISGNKGDDIISYISAIANMRGGHLIIGIEDKTQKIIGIQEFAGYSIENVKFRTIGNCQNLNTDLFEVEEIITTDTHKTIWIFHIPKHQFRLPVYAHKKAWQRIDYNLIEITKARLDAILTEVNPFEDWSAVIIPNASLDDLDIFAIEKARIEYKKRNPKYIVLVDTWDNQTFLNKAKLTI